MRSLSIVVLLLTIISLSNGKNPQFYKANTKLIEDYTIQEFKDNVLNSNRVTIIEYYADWCGFCKNFRQHWHHFANETQLWRKRVLRVAALDCVFEDEWVNEICDGNDVDEYPQFRLYPARETNIKGLKAESEKSRTEDFMKTVINYIEIQRHPPKEWPKLQEFKYAKF